MITTYLLLYFVPFVLLFLFVYSTIRTVFTLLSMAFFSIRHCVLHANMARLVNEVADLNRADARENVVYSNPRWRYEALEAYDWKAALLNCAKWHWTLKDVLGPEAAKIEGVKV